MAFADMFAPMRNFGPTAAATRQANAALMGAAASKKRAETAESLAPWNMAATAVQGIGTLGGLAQKFMEMGQMAPQREALTDYYKAQTDRMSGPLVHQGSVLKIKAGALTRSNQLNAEGKPFNIRNAQDEIKMAVGARKVPGPPFQPSATGEPILGMGGPMQDPAAAILGQPATWDWGDVDPSVRAFAEHHADTLPDWLAQDDAAKLKDVKSYHEAVLSTKIFGAEALKKAQEEFGPDMTAKMQQINMYAGMWEKLQGMGLPAATPAVMGVLQGIDEMSQGFPGRKSPLSKDVLKRLQNLGVAYETQRTAAAGGYLPVSPLESSATTSGIGNSTEGFPRGTTLESITRIMNKKGAPTPEERDVVGIYTVRAAQQSGVAAGRLLQNLGVAAPGENIPTETLNVANKTLQKLMTDIPAQLAELAQAGPRTFTTEQGSSPEFNKLLANLVRARGSVLPEQADDLWRSLVNEATKQLPARKQYGGEGLLPPGKKIGTDPDTGEPIYEGVKGTQPARVTGTTPATHQTITDVLARAQDHLSKLEPDMAPLSAVGWLGGAAQGASASELAAMSKLLGEIVETPKLSAGSDLASALSGSEMRDLFHVGELRGPVSGHTQYRKSYTPAWSINQSGWTDLDEGVGGPGQMTQEVLWQLLGGAAKRGIAAPIAAGAHRLPWLQSIFRAPLIKELGLNRERYED